MGLDLQLRSQMCLSFNLVCGHTGRYQHAWLHNSSLPGHLERTQLTRWQQRRRRTEMMVGAMGMQMGRPWCSAKYAITFSPSTTAPPSGRGMGMTLVAPASRSCCDQGPARSSCIPPRALQRSVLAGRN